jgi:hypothetical protein
MQFINKYNDLLISNSTEKTKKTNVELEIRKKIPLDLFLEVYNKHKTTPHVLKSSFSRSDNNVREESFYVGGERKEKESLIKTKVHSENYKGYTLNISTETFTDKSVTDIKYAKIKFRWSFDILPKWIMDLTLTVELNPSYMAEMVKYYLVGQKRTKLEEIFSYIVESKYYLQKSTILSSDIEFEFVGNDKLKDTDMVDIDNLLDSMKSVRDEDEKSAEIIKKISNLLYPNRQKITNLKELLYNPVTLDRKIFLDIKQDLSEYTVAPKNDGERAIIIIFKSETVLIVTGTEILVLGKETEIKKEEVTYIIDSEFVKSEDKIIAFDTLYFRENLVDLPNSDYLERFSLLESIEKEVGQKITDLEKNKKYKFSLNNVQKFSDLNKEEFFKIAQIKDTDGIILTHFNDPRKVYKWKPLEHNTIDFLIVAADNSLLGKYGFEKTNKKAYILCSGITSEDRKILGLDRHLFEFSQRNKNSDKLEIVPFMSSLDKYSYIWYSDRTDLDMKIGEFCLVDYDTKSEKKTKSWKLVRERPDRDRLVSLGRYYGNYYKVAELTYLYYFNPVLLEQFYTKETNYFRTAKKDQYRIMVGFNNFVKENVLYQVKGTSYLVDLSCGKGQDIFRYNSLGVKNLLAVDKDSDAIAELINRKYSLGKPEFYKYNRNQILSLQEYTFIEARICDLSQNTDVIMRELNPDTKAKFVTMNLAIHYLLDNKKALIEFSKLVDRLLDVGGTFIFSTFCGEKLITDFTALKKAGKPERIEFKDAKFNITKVENMDKIDVLHPFSEEVYRENIVNISEVITQFESLGFVLKQRAYFSEFLTKYRDVSSMTEDEKKYVDYYVYVTLTKV